VNLVILNPNEVSGSGEASLSDHRARHLLGTLHVARGQQVRVGILDGPRGVATVESVSDHTVELRCAFEPEAPARARVDLLLALPRPKVMRRLWAQLAAMGLGRIMVTNAERVERHYFDTHVLTPDCYGPLLIEGLQQARDTRVPVVSIHRQFRVLVEDELDTLFGRRPCDSRMVADPSSARRPSEVLSGDPGGRTLLAIGPEGGWNAFELHMLQAHAFQLVGMGRRTLRTDTACIALLSLLHDTESNESE
jgi:RsmE family RNA methyltransferase